MVASVEDFCYNALMLPTDMEIGIGTVERMRSAPRGVAHLEILVTFVGNYSRDRVFACGPKLAGYRDGNNKPTCGLRLHIPSHLMSHFKILENFASMLRDKHGKMVKKHIKFDEHNKSIYIQIKHENDKEWVDFNVDQAREEKERMNQKRVVRSHLFNNSIVTEASTSAGPKTSMRSGQTGSFVPTKRRRESSGTTGGSNNASAAGASFTGSWRPPAVDDEMA